MEKNLVKTHVWTSHRTCLRLLLCFWYSFGCFALAFHVVILEELTNSWEEGMVETLQSVDEVFSQD